MCCGLVTKGCNGRGYSQFPSDDAGFRLCQPSFGLGPSRCHFMAIRWAREGQGLIDCGGELGRLHRREGGDPVGIGRGAARGECLGTLLPSPVLFTVLLFSALRHMPL